MSLHIYPPLNSYIISARLNSKLANFYKMWYDKHNWNTLRGRIMDKKQVHIICGPGRGKTAAALGQAIQELNNGKSIIMIQFMKGTLKLADDDFLKRLEPEMNIFRFEKLAVPFDQLSEQEKSEELINIKNGLNFANKVLTTGECDVLILDEILGLLDHHIIGEDDIKNMIHNGEDGMELILTGQKLPEGLKGSVNEITWIEKV